MADEQETDQGEKTEEPSQHRIDQFRKRGEVASSKEFTSVLILAASIMTLSISILYIYESLGTFIEWLYSLPHELAFTPKMQKVIVNKIAITALKCVAPIFLTVLSVGIMANIAQVGFLFSPEVLNFKPDRINPINGFKKLFSMRSVVEAAKGVMKFVLIMAIVYFFIKDDLNTYVGFFHHSLIQSFLHAKLMIVKLAFSIIFGMGLVALIDVAYQKFTYNKKLRLTKEQAKKEHKEQEGSPDVKQRIRTIQREMATKRMMADVPKADVIVTNPTHISVALKYDAKTMISPEVIAKGADLLALRIRTVAKENDVPIVENVQLARSLYSAVKVGGAVPRNFYKAIAEILAFVYKLKRKRKALQVRPVE
ncbi:MAG: flagellar biosynthesis protein FlhB [Bacteriovoracaceae bacterium]|nr:flagellar biosynthesis protein FlhB [Bacteriovoracaceae bacterium]